jgi:hypothetical protein
MNKNGLILLLVGFISITAALAQNDQGNCIEYGIKKGDNIAADATTASLKQPNATYVGDDFITNTTNGSLKTPSDILNRNKDLTISSTIRKPQVIYLNLFGEGNLLSINYDRRFKNQNDGWGWHAGIGGLVLSEDNFTEINLPVGINYLIGKKGNFLELGLNESIIFDKLTQPAGGEADLTNLYGITIHGTNSLWSLTSGTIGYRLQPKNSGFCFRVGILPYITFIDGKLEKPSQSPTGYMSFGYKF